MSLRNFTLNVLLCVFTLFSCHLYADISDDVTLIDSPYTKQQIEILIKKPSSTNYPLLLFLHGASGKGLTGISESWYDHWLNKGYAVSAVSLPGYGGSTGKKDFCGPLTLESLNFAIDFIKDQLDISDLGIIGFGQGALAGILLATQRDDIRCLVASNCGYDFFRHRNPDDEVARLIKEKDYDIDLSDDQALRYRSPISHVNSINTPLFLLHRKHNPVIQEEEVLDFYHAMLAAGKACHLWLTDQPGENEQKLSYEEILTATESWVDDLMSAPCR